MRGLQVDRQTWEGVQEMEARRTEAIRHQPREVRGLHAVVIVETTDTVSWPLPVAATMRAEVEEATLHIQEEETQDKLEEQKRERQEGAARSDRSVLTRSARRCSMQGAIQDILRGEGGMERERSRRV